MVPQTKPGILVVWERTIQGSENQEVECSLRAILESGFCRYYNRQNLKVVSHSCFLAYTLFIIPSVCMCTGASQYDRLATALMRLYCMTKMKRFCRFEVIKREITLGGPDLTTSESFNRGSEM